MDQTTKALLRILDQGTPELQVAVTQVLGELRTSEAAVSRALSARLSAGETFLAPFVLEALGRIGDAGAVEVLVSKLRMGGATADRAAHLLRQMGREATVALSVVFDEGDAEMQERILSILGEHRDKEALAILLRGLLRGHPQLSERAAGVIHDLLPSLDAKSHDYLDKSLQKALSSRNAAELEPADVAHALGVLAELKGAASRTTLLRFCKPKSSPVVRQAALRALEGINLTPTQSKTILEYIAEDDMTHVVRPAMQLLESIEEWSPPAVDALKKMLESPSEERVLFALRALRQRHTEKMGRVCLEMLLHRGPEFREPAIAALAENPMALGALLKAFQTERNIDRARLLAQPLAKLGKKLTAAQIKPLVEKASKLLTNGEPFGEVYVTALLDSCPKLACRELVAKAVRLRRARRLPDGLKLLLRLAQSDHMTDEGRYQLGVARLMYDDQEPVTGDRKESGDATMGYFAGLVRDDFPLLARLKKEGQLNAEQLLRVGQHFATGVAKERQFGGELLHFLAHKHGQKRAGEDAKLALRTAGL